MMMRITAVLGCITLAACGMQRQENIAAPLHDNIDTCSKPDNATFYAVVAGTPCNPGDHSALPCYLPGGAVVDVLRGEKGPVVECLSRGGAFTPPSK
jgi:hypothetical protein